MNSVVDSPVVLDVTIAEQKRQINALLEMGFLKVLFTKKSDGSDRTIIGTKMVDYVPDFVKTAHKPRKENEFIVTLFDVEKDEWRSFSLENLKRIWVVNDPVLWGKADQRLYEKENARESEHYEAIIEVVGVSEDTTTI